MGLGNRFTVGTYGAGTHRDPGGLHETWMDDPVTTLLQPVKLEDPHRHDAARERRRGRQTPQKECRLRCQKPKAVSLHNPKPALKPDRLPAGRTTRTLRVRLEPMEVPYGHWDRHRGQHGLRAQGAWGVRWHRAWKALEGFGKL